MSSFFVGVVKSDAFRMRTVTTAAAQSESN